MYEFLQGLINVILVLCSLFLICLILIQRGKGGGLAGAFGGTGGSSAFGAKAGDIFTKITMITAGIWIGLAMLLVMLTNNAAPRSAYDIEGGTSANDIPIPGSDTSPADGDLFPRVQGASPGSSPTSGTAPAASTVPSGSSSSPAPSPAGTPPPGNSNPGPAGIPAPPG